MKVHAVWYPKSSSENCSISWCNNWSTLQLWPQDEFQYSGNMLRGHFRVCSLPVFHSICFSCFPFFEMLETSLQTALKNLNPWMNVTSVVDHIWLTAPFNCLLNSLTEVIVIMRLRQLSHICSYTKISNFWIFECYRNTSTGKWNFVILP
jgi:hypothetical protein